MSTLTPDSFGSLEVFSTSNNLSTSSTETANTYEKKNPFLFREPFPEVCRGALVRVTLLVKHADGIERREFRSVWPKSVTRYGQHFCNVRVITARVSRGRNNRNINTIIIIITYYNND